MSCAVNKVKLDNSLKNLYNSALKNAAYEAYKVAAGYYDVDKNLEKEKSNAASNGVSNAFAPDSESKQIKESIDKSSHDFADEFVKQLQNANFLETIADEIDSHVKSASININVPVIPPTLITAMGPVTGSLVISELAGAQITIS